MEAFYSGATHVAERLLEGVASHLGLPRGHFAPSFDPHTSYLRLNYYPPCPEPCGKLSVNRHSDAGALTVLLQEEGTTALQVRWGRLRCYLGCFAGWLTVFTGSPLSGAKLIRP